MTTTLGAVADVLGLLCLLGGATLALTSSIGLLRLPDLFSRLHAATKPQVLGQLLVLLGVGLRLRTGEHVGMLVLVAGFQLLTIPVAGHLVSRSQYRLYGVPDDPASPRRRGRHRRRRR